ncbi:MAG: helix-turn-helix domain-containing protein [Planctomycetaceae bacterium]|nr:helix-turn-helix domain-containing protein [Planctomycetaceae bacterium]
MNPHIHRILVRLETIALEATVLHKDLRTALKAEGAVMMRQVDLSMFKDTTRRLLKELLNAPGNMLSHSEIRQGVMIDVMASDSAVRNVVKRARKEMRACRDCPYEIKTIIRKGYRLEKTEMYQDVSKKPKISPKSRRT